MEKSEAQRIRLAAIVMLHAIKTDLGDNDVVAALKYLPVPAEHAEHVSLRTAREILDKVSAWKDAR